MESRRIAIFTTRVSDPGTVEAVEALHLAFPDAQFLVVAGDPKIARSRWLRNKLRRLGRQPLSYPLELAGQVLEKIGLVISRRRERSESGDVGLPRCEDLDGVEAEHFGWIHDPKCLARVAAFRPWLGVSVGAPILKEELFGIPELGTINLHKSVLPEYRGMPAGFWEMHDGADTAGVSVHWMERGLDTGDVVLQRELPIARFATPDGLRIVLDQLGLDALVDAVRHIDAGTATRTPQGEARTPTRSRPPLLLNRRIRRRALNRRPGSRGLAGLPRNLIKGAALWSFVHLWVPLRNWSRGRKGQCHAIVLLWHRIDDAFHDSISTGVEQFERQLAILRHRYDLLDLQTFVEERGKPRQRPVVVVTFDDGYRDNFNASRLLRRHGIPATFFLSTRIVDSDAKFPYDAEVDDPPPSLTWEEVREMSRRGFTFGNHTQLHTNVAEAPLADALSAIESASADLRRELPNNPGDRWFAYPFGWEKDMTEAVRQALPEHGISLCLSAYGGANPPDWDVWDVRRQGVAANVSDLAFRALVEGWQVRG